VEHAHAVVAATSQLKEAREAVDRHATEAREAVDRHATEARESAEKAANEAKEAASAAANEARAKAEEIANAAGAAVDEARAKAAQLANAAGDAVNGVKAKAEEMVMVVGDGINETKRQTQVLITVVGVNFSRFEHQFSKLLKLGLAALPAPPARTVGEADDVRFAFTTPVSALLTPAQDLVEWKRCRRCQLQFDPAAPWQEGACSYHAARWECGVLEGDEEGPFSFTRRHVFGAQKCADDCEGRFPCCGARQRLNGSSSSGCRTKEMHIADE